MNYFLDRWAVEIGLDPFRRWSAVTGIIDVVYVEATQNRQGILQPAQAASSTYQSIFDLR